MFLHAETLVFQCFYTPWVQNHCNTSVFTFLGVFLHTNTSVFTPLARVKTLVFSHVLLSVLHPASVFTLNTSVLHIVKCFTPNTSVLHGDQVFLHGGENTQTLVFLHQV